MVTQPKRESDIQGDVVAYARSLRIIARKLNFGEGWPDYVFLFKGRVLFIEFKRPGESPTHLQNQMRSILKAEGFRVEVVDSIQIGTQLIRDFYHDANYQLGQVRSSDD